MSSQQSISSIYFSLNRFVKSVNNMNATVLVPSKLRDMDMPGPVHKTPAKSSSKANTTTASSGGKNAPSVVRRIPPALANSDLYSFYMMLNDVKKELLWGPGTGAATAAVQTLVGQTTSMGSGVLSNNSNNCNNAVTLIQNNASGAASATTTTTCTTTTTMVLDRGSPRRQSLKQHVRQPSDDSLGSLGGSSSTASSSNSSDPDTDSEADSLMTDRDSVDEHTSHLAAAFRHHLQGLHTILHQLAESADYLSTRYQEDIDAVSL